MPPTNDEPTTVGDQLGLGRNWRPTPASWRWAEVVQGTQRLHVLVIEGVAGTDAMALSDEAMDRFIESAQAHRSGITIEREPFQLPNRVGLPSIGGRQ